MGFNPATIDAIKPGQVLALQMMVGNQVVNRLIQSQHNRTFLLRHPGVEGNKLQQKTDNANRGQHPRTAGTAVEATISEPANKIQRQEPELLQNEQELLDDLESGTASIKNHLQYIEQGMALINEHGPDKLKDTGLIEGMEVAASQMLKPTKHLQKKLGKLKKFVDNVQGFRKWLSTGRALAEAIKGNISDLENLQAIIDALKDHAEATEPYYDMLTAWLTKAGRAGAKAGAVLGIVEGYARVAISAVENGSKVQHKLSHKSENWLKKNLPGEFPGDDGLEIPHPPLEWSSSQEIRENREEREERRRRWEEEKRKTARRKKLVAEFDKDVFPKIWRRKRRQFYNKIVRMLRQEGTSRNAILWYQTIEKHDPNVVYKNYQGTGMETSPNWDSKAGRNIDPLLPNIGGELLESEINAFKEGRIPRWPEFDKLYADALIKHIKSADEKEAREAGLAIGMGIKAAMDLLGISDLFK